MSIPAPMTDTPWLPLAAGSGVMAVLGVTELAAENWFQGLSQLGVAGGMIYLWYYKTRFTDVEVAKTNAAAVDRVGDVMAKAVSELKDQIEADNKELRTDLRANQEHMFKLLNGYMSCPTKPKE